jgi:hypothetical protein
VEKELIIGAGCRSEAEIPLLRDWMLDEFVKLIPFTHQFTTSRVHHL